MECSHAYHGTLEAVVGTKGEDGSIVLHWAEGQTETLISRELLESLVRDANAFRRM